MTDYYIPWLYNAMCKTKIWKPKIQKHKKLKQEDENLVLPKKVVENADL